MGQKQNPLRLLAESPFAIPGGTDNLVANGIYSVDDIVRPVLTQSGTGGDPRTYVAYGPRRTRIKWRRVSKNGWISPKRKQDGDRDTVIQIRYARPKRLNYVSFELLRVPQSWNVQYYDATRKRMVPLTNENGAPLGGNLGGFKVNVVDPQQQKNNSQKWTLYEYETPNISTNLIEIHLNRQSANTPLDFFGLPKDTPYSLGLRKVKVKLKIDNDDDVDDDSDDGTPTPIGTTERPMVVRHTSTNAIDGAATTYWECGPQGGANSVVPFYLDMRADDGTATIFDRIKMTPLWTGPNMSVYWSNDDVTTTWKISANRSELARLGSADFTVDTGISVSAASQGWSITNDYMKADLSKSLTVGLLFTPTDTSTSTDRYLWTFERPGSSLAYALRYNWASGGGSSMTGVFEVVKVVSGITSVLFTSGTYTLAKGSQYGVVLGYNQNGLDPTSTQGWHFAFSAQPATDATITSEQNSTNAAPTFYPTDLVIGSDQAALLDRPMLGTIVDFWVRMDTYSQAATAAYLKAPAQFVAGHGVQTQRVNGFYDTILIAKCLKDTSVRIGPGAGFYRNKSWTPISTDFPLRASHYKLGLINAKFLKLEFTNLVSRVYLTEDKILPINTFPQWVTDHYRNTIINGKKGPYTLAGGRNFFESVPALPTPGDPRRLPDVRSSLQGQGGTGVPPTIFHTDQASTDYSINPDAFDGAAGYRELQFATTPQRFFSVGRHEYMTHWVTSRHRAFFVGIKEIQVFRTDQTVQFDSREYVETYDDSLFIASSTGWTNVGGVLEAAAANDVITSNEFTSFSNFNTIQMAVLDSGWESGFSDAQINLNTITQLVDPLENAFNGTHDTATTHFDVVTGQYQGASGGNVLQVTRTAGSIVPYGIRTVTGGYATTVSGSNPRTSTVVRIQLPQTNNGSYELRLYQNGNLVASKPIVIPVKTWQECELAYIANSGDSNWECSVVQTNASITEPFIVDMLGIWQNPIKWEVSNDNGGSWQTVLWPLNRPTGYLRFKADDYRLKVRTTALRASAVVSGWTIVPWYIESSMVMRAPIDYTPPWGVSDQEDLLDTSRKPIFQTWSRYFPQRFSTNLYGLY